MPGWTVHYWVGYLGNPLGNPLEHLPLSHSNPSNCPPDPVTHWLKPVPRIWEGGIANSRALPALFLQGLSSPASRESQTWDRGSEQGTDSFRSLSMLLFILSAFLLLPDIVNMYNLPTHKSPGSTHLLTHTLQHPGRLAWLPPGPADSSTALFMEGNVCPVVPGKEDITLCRWDGKNKALDQPSGL